MLELPLAAEPWDTRNKEKLLGEVSLRTGGQEVLGQPSWGLAGSPWPATSTLLVVSFPICEME